MDIYCTNCKKHTECTHPKNLVSISDKKAKGQSKCVEVWLIERFLIK